MNQCNIVKDLLPLYVEDLVSEDTKCYVEDHLNTCESCQNELKQLKLGKIEVSNDATIPLKKIKKNLERKQLKTILVTASLVILAFGIVIFGFLTKHNPARNPNNILTVIESDDEVIIEFQPEIAGYEVYNEIIDNEFMSYKLYAWYTEWNRISNNDEILRFSVNKNEINNFIIEYSDYENDKLIYSTSGYLGQSFHVLVALRLGYYLMIDLAIIVILSIMLMIYRKNHNFKIWLQRMILLPICYLFGHFSIKGFNTISITISRDFLLICAVTICMYCASLMLFNHLCVNVSKREIF